MTDLEFSLLLLATVSQLGQSVREESVRLLLDSESQKRTMEALASGNAAVLPGWKGQAAAAFKVRSGEAETRARTVYKQCANIGARLIFRGSPDYPDCLLDLDAPPPVLYARGNPEALSGGSGRVAMVGSRQPTELGVKFARRSASELAAAGIKVISGLALGTDAAVHRGALDSGGCTIAVLASGVGSLTPRRNAGLGRRILEDGAVVSEQPPGTQVGPWSFPDRNRIIAALAQHVVILEAGVGSGTTITGEAALELNRQLWVMPGRPSDPATAGGLQLLSFEAARVFTGSRQLLESIPGVVADPASATLGTDLVELAHLIAGHLPCRLDQLPDALGLSDQIPVLIGGLNLLKLNRIVHEDATGQLTLVGELPLQRQVR